MKVGRSRGRRRSILKAPQEAGRFYGEEWFLKTVPWRGKGPLERSAVLRLSCGGEKVLWRGKVFEDSPVEGRRSCGEERYFEDSPVEGRRSCGE